jgi:phosphate acetyltransferase
MTPSYSVRILFVAPTAPDSRVSAVTLGLVRALQATGHKVGFVKPIGDPDAPAGETDRSVHFARVLFGGGTPEAIPMARAEEMIRTDQSATLLEEVVALVHDGGEGRDVVVVEGAALADGHSLVAELDLAVARALNAEIVAVAAGQSGNVQAIVDAIADAAHRFGRDGVPLAGAVVARLPEALIEAVRAAPLAAPLIGVVSEDPALSAPRLSDIVNDLGFVVAHAGDLSRARMREVVVAARSPEHLVSFLRPGTLVVTPGDRADVVITTTLASAGGMPIAGVLLTCGAELSPLLADFLEPRFGGLTVLRTELQTFDAVARLSDADRRVRIDDAPRMERLVEHAAEALDLTTITALNGGTPSRLMSPPMFRHELIRAARAGAKRIVLPEGDEPRTLQAAAICSSKRIARCVLLGKPEVVRGVAARHGIELPSGVEIVDPEAIRDKYVAPMVELRRSKGLTSEQAVAQLEDTVVLGTMMLAEGHVDGLVSGAVHTTASTVRPALQLIKTAPGNSIVSSVFFMLMPDQVLVYGDCAINPDPSAEELAEIATQSADSAAAFGLEPRVAMISYSTGSSGSGGDVEKVREATRIVKERRPELIVDGPIQYDAASVESVGRQKAPGSPLAGQANVFIFPDLNTGNTTYKAVQRSAGVVSVGPMLQGLRKPVNDLSRGALVDDIVFTIALTAIQAGPR